MTFNWCHNNHLKFGWDNQTYGKRQTLEQKFWVTYSPCEYKPASWRDECIKAAELIYEYSSDPIKVHLSGGIDSEVVARSFIEAGYPFTAVIWRYNNNLNEHDIYYAIRFCQKNNIKIEIVDVDIVKFLEKDIYKIVDEYNEPFWSMALQQYILKEITGHSIFAEGLLYFSFDDANMNRQYGIEYNISRHNIPKDEPYLLELECSSNTFNCMIDNNSTGSPRFFKYTSEMILAYMNNEYLQNWLTYGNDNFVDDILYPYMGKMITGNEYKKKPIQNVLKIKQNIYYHYWPEMEKRIKFSGLEKLDTLKKQVNGILGKRFVLGEENQQFIPITYKALYSKLSEKL